MFNDYEATENESFELLKRQRNHPKVLDNAGQSMMALLTYISREKDLEAVKPLEMFAAREIPEALVILKTSSALDAARMLWHGS